MAVVEAEQLYTREEAANLLRCSVDTIDKLLAQGRNGLWPSYKIRGLVRIPEKAIVRLLRSRRLN